MKSILFVINIRVIFRSLDIQLNRHFSNFGHEINSRQPKLVFNFTYECSDFSEIIISSIMLIVHPLAVFLGFQKVAVIRNGSINVNSYPNQMAQ